MPTQLTDRILRADAQADIIGPIRMASEGLKAAASELEQKQKELADRLRGLREREGVSLRDIAIRMRLSAGYISDVELGRRNLLPAFAEKYVEAVIQLRRKS